MITDRSGNTLLGFAPVPAFPLTAALVVAVFTGDVLMIFDSGRRQWELPGGMLDPGETPAVAAAREFTEETGIVDVPLDFVTMADFSLTNPDRHESLAVYRTHLAVPPRLVVNEEALDFLWWSPTSTLVSGMNPLDAEMARYAMR